MSDRNWIRRHASAIIVSTGSAVLAGLLLANLGSVWAYLTSTMPDYFGRNVVLPMWLLWLLIGLSVLFMVRVLFLILRPREAPPPEHQAFRWMVHDGIVWTWDWDGGEVDTTSLMALCPTCQTEVVWGGEYPLLAGQFRCGRCQKSTVKAYESHHNAVMSAKREIERSVRSGDWKRQRDESF